MTGWTISIDATSDTNITDEEVDQLVAAFHNYGGSISYKPDGRLGVTFSIDADSIPADFDIADVAQHGTRVFLLTLLRDLGRDDWTIVRLDVCTYEEHDAELAQPAYPTLVGVAELAELLNVSPQRASDLRSRKGFPAPIAELKSGPVWVKTNVEHFAGTWKRKPGRPRKGTSGRPVDAPLVN